MKTIIKSIIISLLVLTSYLWPGNTTFGQGHLDSSRCKGLASFHNRCSNQTLYVHVCYGAGGGITNFTLPPGQAHQLHVSQWTTFDWACGSPSFNNNCPARALTELDYCE